MKRVIFLSATICLCLLPACKDDESGNGTAPMPIQECTIEPISGGAIIYYTIPSDRNIMYVMAEYKRNGKQYVERSSAHNNWLTIEGFNTSDPVKAKLYTVNKNEVRSDSALTVNFIPKESPIGMAFKSLKILTGFLGVVAYWDNPTRTELGVRLMIDSVDRKGKVHWVEKNMYFSRLASERKAFRGFDTLTYTFAISLTDKWGNISDTAKHTCKPFFERMTPKPFSTRFWDPANNPPKVPFDQNTHLNTTVTFSRMSDGVTVDPPNQGGANSWLTEARSDRQAMFTLDLQRKFRLSRMVLWPRTGHRDWNIEPWIHLYTVNNVLKFEIWGTDVPDNEWPLSDRGYWLHEFSLNAPTFEPDVPISDRTFRDDWQYMGFFEVPRYDKMGYPGEVQLALRNLGWEFDFDPDKNPVRYIRFFVRETDKGAPTPNAVFQICELSIFGNDLIPQK